MAQTVTVNLEVKDNTKSLKAQLKEAQMEVQTLADKYGATSAQATEAAKRAADLKDRIGDAKALTDAYNPDAKFKALGASLTGVAGGFSAVQGAMGLVGAEGAEVQKMMLKVQSAMALSQGLNALGEARDSFKNLGKQLGDTFKNLSSESSLAGKATSALGPIWKAVGVSGKNALQGIRAGIAATGIGLLVVALGTVVAYWDDIKSAVSGVTREEKKNLENQTKSAEIAQKRLDIFSLEEKQLKLIGKSDEYINKERRKRILTAIEELKVKIAAQEQINKVEIAAAKRNKEAAQAAIKFLVGSVTFFIKNAAIGIDVIIKGINLALEAMGKKTIPTLSGAVDELETKIADRLAGGLFDPKQVEEDGKAAIDEAKNQLKELRGQYYDNELALQDINNKGNDNKEKDQKEHDQSMTEYLNALEAKRQADIISAREKEEQEIANKYDALYALADKAGQDTHELQIQQANEMGAIRLKYQKIEEEERKKKEEEQLKMMQEMDKQALMQFIESEQIRINAMAEGYDKEAAIRKLAYDKEQIDLQEKLDTQLITMDQFQTASKYNYDNYQTELNKISKSSYEQRVKNDLAEYEQKASIQNQMADLATQAANLLKDTLGKSKAAQKTAVIIESAAGIAKMIISNKLANAGALATPQAIATSGASAVPVIAMNNASTALGIAANIAATAKALKEIGGGGTAPSGGGAGGAGMATGGGGVNAPNFNVVGNNGLNQLAQLQQQPIKAYVVGSEVTTQQALDRNRITNSQI